MRLIVARCEVRYTGRLSTVLPEALRLLMLKSDGSVMVHADTGGFKPQNWMTPPTIIEEEPGLVVVRKKGAEDRIEIRISEVLSDVTHDMGEAAALEKEGVERELQELLADAPPDGRTTALRGTSVSEPRISRSTDGTHPSPPSSTPEQDAAADPDGRQPRCDERRPRPQTPVLALDLRPQRVLDQL